MADEARAPRTAFVTGASYGVGEATALAFAHNGCDVAVSATKRSNLDRVVAALADLGVKAVPVVLDLRSQASIGEAMDQAIAGLGEIDVLVNNAGAHRRKPMVEITPQDWDFVVSANLTGTFFLTQRFGRHLIEAGRPGSIVTITSTHGLVGAPDRSLYGISKAALNHMTKMLAVEWADHGIRVNAVAPGRIMTDSPSRAETGNDPAYIDAMLRRIPLHRMATAEQIAAAALFLAGPQAGAITGHTLVVDGGLTVV